jgi:hypothetical protein
VRHATPGDLEQVQALLEGLRTIPGLVERKPGNFSWRSRPFLHFHHDPSGMYVDARLGDGDFERQRVTTAREQARFLGQVRRALRGRTVAGEGPVP